MNRVPGSSEEFNRQPLLIESAKLLRNRLRSAAIWLYRINPQTGKVFQFPGKVRGNSAYRAARLERIRGIQKSLNQLVEERHFSQGYDEWDASNALFVTLTTDNPLFLPDTLERLAFDWGEHNRLRDRAFKKLKRRGMRSHVYSVEATARGGFHIHAVLVFDRFFRGWTDSEGRWRSDEGRELIREVWPYLSDVQLVRKGEGAGYVTKELYKVGSVEQPLKKFDADEPLTPAEAKTLLTFALAAKSGRRMLSTSRDITEGIAPEPEEDTGEESERLDDKRNNLPREWITLAYSLTDMKRMLGDRPPPYTGEIAAGTPLHGLMLQKARAIAEGWGDLPPEGPTRP